MIAQGSDGLSRGNLAEGVMRGAGMKGFIPINKTAFERAPELRKWLNQWTHQSVLFLNQWDGLRPGRKLLKILGK